MLRLGFVTIVRLRTSRGIPVLDGSELNVPICFHRLIDEHLVGGMGACGMA